MVLKSLIDFCYGTCWVKNIKGNLKCLNKYQIKDAVGYLLSYCYFTVVPNIICRVIGIPMWSV